MPAELRACAQLTRGKARALDLRKAPHIRNQVDAHFLQAIGAGSEWHSVGLFVGNRFAAELACNLQSETRNREKAAGRIGRIALAVEGQVRVRTLPRGGKRKQSNIVSDRLCGLLLVLGVCLFVGLVQFYVAHRAHVISSRLLQVSEPDDGLDQRSVAVDPTVSYMLEIGNAMRRGKHGCWIDDRRPAEIKGAAVGCGPNAKSNLPRPIADISQQAPDDLRTPDACSRALTRLCVREGSLANDQRKREEPHDPLMVLEIHGAPNPDGRSKPSTRL